MGDGYYTSDPHPSRTKYTHIILYSFFFEHVLYLHELWDRGYLKLKVELKLRFEYIVNTVYIYKVYSLLGQ